MSKRKSTGRISVEEVDALFQKPLRLLHRRASVVEPSPTPPDVAQRGDEVPMDRRTEPFVDADTEIQANNASQQVPSNVSSAGATRALWLDRLLSAAKHLKSRTDDRARQHLAPTEAAPASVLAARLGENLLEASCLAAELHRRHRQEQSEYERAVNDLRNLTALLVDQLEPAPRATGVREGQPPKVGIGGSHSSPTGDDGE